MKVRSVPLSSVENGQAHRHGLKKVYAQDLNYWDKVVANLWVNRHLSDSILQQRSRDNRPYWEITDIGSVLLQNNIVGEWIKEETQKIGGSTDGDGRPIPGEIQKLEDERQMLTDWLEAPEAAKLDVTFYDDVLGRRRAPRNRLNIHAAIKSKRMKELKEVRNPSAALAVGLVVRQDFRDRFHQLLDEGKINDNRNYRGHELTFDENEQMFAVMAMLRELAREPTMPTLRELEIASSQLNFSHKALNQLGSTISTPEKGYRVEDPADVEVAIDGIFFEGYTGYFRQPFRVLGDLSGAEIAGGRMSIVDGLLPQVEERVEELEGLDIGGSINF